MADRVIQIRCETCDVVLYQGLPAYVQVVQDHIQMGHHIKAEDLELDPPAVTGDELKVCVYLCGGINGLSTSDATDWREAAKRMLGDDFVTLDPMRRDYRGKELDNVAEIVEADEKDIFMSDVVLAWCPKPSWGTAMEIIIAHRNDTPVFAVVPNTDLRYVSPWLLYHTRVFPNLNDAIEAIREPAQ